MSVERASCHDWSRPLAIGCQPHQQSAPVFPERLALGSTSRTVLASPTGRGKYQKVDTRTAPACKSKLCKNQENATHRLSSGGGAVEQPGGQTIDGGLVDGHEAERLVEGKGRLVGRQGLHLDEGPGVLSCPPDHLGDQIPAIAFAAMGRGHLDAAQTGAGPSVAATEPGHVPGGGPRQLGSVGSGQQTKTGEMKLAQGLVLPPVDR